MLQASAAATLRSPVPMGPSGMQRIPPGTNIIGHLYSHGVVHVTNLGDEVIEGGRADLIDRDAAYGTRGSALGQALEVYKPRMAPSFPMGSVIVLPERLVSETRTTLRYLRDLGLAELPDDAVIGVPTVQPRFSASVLEYAGRLTTALGGPTHLLPFIQSPETGCLAEQLGLAVDASADAVDLANNKGAGYEALKARGVRVPFGGWVHTEEGVRDLFATITARGEGPAFGKLARAVSGYGVWELKNGIDLEAFLRREPVQLQLADPQLGIRLDQGIDVASSPSMTVYVGRTPGEDRYISASRQILVKPDTSATRATIHSGNVGPLTPEEESSIWTPMCTVMEWLRSIGAFGLCGADFVIERGTGYAYWLEVNHRMNGSMPGGFPALGRGAAVWSAHSTIPVPTGATLDTYVAFLQSEGIAYDPARGVGVFVVNAATGAKGMMQIGVIASSYEEVAHFYTGAAQMVR